MEPASTQYLLLKVNTFRTALSQAVHLWPQVEGLWWLGALNQAAMIRMEGLLTRFHRQNKPFRLLILTWVLARDVQNYLFRISDRSKRRTTRRSTRGNPASKEPLRLSCHGKGHSVHTTTTNNLVEFLVYPKTVKSKIQGGISSVKLCLAI